MSRPSRSYAGFSAGDAIPMAVRYLLLANGLVFLAQNILRGPGLEQVFGLVPRDLFGRWHLWQPLTYMFLHGSLFHLLFNMLAVFMFGAELERAWGTREFLVYYLVTGVGAGLTQWAVSIHSPVPVIGASGAVFGLLLAFGMMFPDRPILLWFVLPIPAKYLVILFGFIELAAVAAGRGGGVARFAHLGGLLVGFLYLKSEKYLWPVKRWIGGVRRQGQARERAAEEERRRADQDRIDQVLDKISREGMGSLTPAERKTLEEAGRRGREKKRP